MDEIPVMDLIDECSAAPKVMAEILLSIQINTRRAVDLCQKGFISSPDLVERMVAEWDLPFRRAKKVVEKAVRYSEAEGVDKISLNAFRRALQEEKITVSADQRFIDQAQDPKTLVGLRRITGGPAPAVLQENIVFLNRAKKSLLKWVSSKRRKISSAESLLRKREKAL